MTLAALTGPFGVLANTTISSNASRVRPNFHILRALSAMAGHMRIDCANSAPGKIQALAAGAADGRADLWVANLTDRSQSDIQSEGWKIRCFEFVTCREARAGEFPSARTLSSCNFELTPFAVAHLHRA
jgi:hypothetical protein